MSSRASASWGSRPWTPRRTASFAGALQYLEYDFFTRLNEYLPDVGVTDIGFVDPGSPMDFHAWFEVWLDGAWRTFDARHNVPRMGRSIIATGPCKKSADEKRSATT